MLAQTTPSLLEALLPYLLAGGVAGGLWFVLGPGLRKLVDARNRGKDAYLIADGRGGSLPITAERLRMLIERWPEAEVSPPSTRPASARIDGWGFDWVDDESAACVRVSVHSGALRPLAGLTPFARATFDALTGTLNHVTVTPETLAFALAFEDNLEDAGHAVRAALRTAAFLEHLGDDPLRQFEASLSAGMADVDALERLLSSLSEGDRAPYLEALLSAGTAPMALAAARHADASRRVRLLEKAAEGELSAVEAREAFDGLISNAGEDRLDLLLGCAARADSDWAGDAVDALLARYAADGPRVLSRLSRAASTGAVRDAVADRGRQFAGGLAVADATSGELSVADAEGALSPGD